MNMVYIRNKKIKGKTYYYIVEGKIDERGKVKQKDLLYFTDYDHHDNIYGKSLNRFFS